MTRTRPPTTVHVIQEERDRRLSFASVGRVNRRFPMPPPFRGYRSHVFSSMNVHVYMAKRAQASNSVSSAGPRGTAAVDARETGRRLWRGWKKPLTLCPRLFT